MGHAYGCAWRRYQKCDCSVGSPVQRPVASQICDRIREIEEELNEYFRLIGQGIILGIDAELATHSAHQCQARIEELKNVLKMLEAA